MDEGLEISAPIEEDSPDKLSVGVDERLLVMLKVGKAKEEIEA